MTPPLPREQFPVADRFRYLNHARVAAPPTVVAHALARDASAATMLGSTAAIRREERTERVRAACASLLGAPADDVSFVRNTTDGLGVIANGLDWSAGDQVAVADHEFPLTRAVFDTLADRGVEVVTLPVEAGWTLEPGVLDRALAESDGAIRAVVVSWVGYARGGRNDPAALAEVAHRHGAILVVDLIQGLGVIPADVTRWGVDAAAAGAHKWMLGPEGIGVLTTTPSLRERLRIPVPGPGLVVTEDARSRLDTSLDTTGRRFEGSTANLAGIAGLGAAVELLAGTGVAAVWDHVDGLGAELTASLVELGATIESDRSPAARSAIVAARFDGVDAEAVVERLVPRGVIVSAWHGAVRFSPHGWNDSHDVQATIGALRRVV